MNDNEKLVVLNSFVYQHEAHFAKSFLESEGIECELKDELTAQMQNFYSNAIGGVKILVKESDYTRSLELLKTGGFIVSEDFKENKIEIVKIDRDFNKEFCPFCKSENISIKKVPGVLTVMLLFIFKAPFPFFRKSFKCYDCEKEWKYIRK